MNFQLSRNHLQTIFQNNSFTENVRNGRTHATQIVMETCSNGTQISISFPGYKAYISGNRTVYDYRVDITKNGVTTSLSHANIIVDIYNKIVSGGMSGRELKNVLTEIAQEGSIDIPAITARLPYNSGVPSEEIINKVKNAHGTKLYNQTGNSFDLTLEELLLSLKWIVLQEDINYPISNGYEGRKMPFARYIEAIFVTESNNRNLEEVIERALSHSRPHQWTEMDYSFRNLIR